MIRTQTVFVIGAGASREVGLPLGVELTKQIASTLNLRGGSGDSTERELVRSAVVVVCDPANGTRGLDGLFNKARAVSMALSTAASIDVFIDNHSDDLDIALLGKFGIAACLVEGERGSKLYPGLRNEFTDMTQIEGTWFGNLFHILSEGIKATSVEKMFESVSFIIFNYDRCLEFFLEQAIASRFRMDLASARRIVLDHCRIVHPYGSLGAFGGSTRVVDFGHRLKSGTFATGDIIIQMSKSLRTFAEADAGIGASDSKRMIAEAERVIFLGFGFHPQNVELLQVPHSAVRECRATAYEMSESNQREILQSIKRIVKKAHLRGDDFLLNMKCGPMIVAEQLFLSR